MERLQLSPTGPRPAQKVQAILASPQQDTSSTLQIHPGAETFCCASCWTALWRAFLITVGNIWKGIAIVFSWCCCKFSETPFETIKRDPEAFLNRYNSNRDSVEKELIEFIVKNPEKALAHFEAVFREMQEINKESLDDPYYDLLYGTPDLKKIVIQALSKASRSDHQYLEAYRTFKVTFNPTKMKSMKDPFETLRTNPEEIRARFEEDRERLGQELMKFILAKYETRVPEFNEIFKTIANKPEFVWLIQNEIFIRNYIRLAFGAENLIEHPAYRAFIMQAIP